MNASSHNLDSVRVRFDAQGLVANAGLILPATLAHRLGLRDLIDRHVRLGDGTGAANPGEKAMTVVATMIAGGDHIDDVNALRNVRTQAVLGHRVAAASTVGTFLRAFSHGHVRQLDAVIEDSFQRAWELGARPDQEVVKLDLDSSLIETYGFKKQGGNRGSPTCTRAATTRCSRSSRAAVRCCTRASADAFCSLNAQANAHDNGQLTTALLKTPKSWFACPRDAPADVRRVGQLRLTADSKGEKGIDRRFERTGTLKHLRE